MNYTLLRSGSTVVTFKLSLTNVSNMIQATSSPNSVSSGWDNVKVGDTVRFDQVLTEDDKKIVSLSGEKIDGSSSKVPHLAVAIALARQNGTLIGPVTTGFLNQASNISSISSSIIQKARNYLISSDPIKQERPNHTLSYAT